MPRVVGQVIAFYGKDHIGYALRAIAPFCDEVFVFLTDQPSHGTTTNLVCPDSPKEMMEAICGAGIGNKLRVIRGRWNNEGEHRNEILKYVQDGDLIVIADADEIHVAEQLERNIQYMQANDFERMKVRMTTLWRSFGWYCTDPMMQDRLIKVGATSGVCYAPFSELPERADVFHAGYARMPNDVEFKQKIHGHVLEWRQGWFEQKFLGWRPNNGVTDLHPTCVDFWTAQPFNKELLPAGLKNHPFYQMEVIE